MIEASFPRNKVVIVRSVCWIVQFTSFLSLYLIINTDAVWFVVTKQFTETHIRDMLDN